MTEEEAPSLTDSIRQITIPHTVQCAWTHSGNRCDHTTKASVSIELTSSLDFMSLVPTSNSVRFKILSADGGLMVEDSCWWICADHIEPALKANLVAIKKGIVDVSK